MNSINLIGRLTKDPELSQTIDMTSVARFTLATDGVKKTTYFFDCVAFRGTADIIIKYCRKGSQIGVSGTLTQEKYTRKDGTTNTTYRIIVDRMDMLDSKKEESTEPTGESNNGTFTPEDAYKDQPDTQIDSEEELPF